MKMFINLINQLHTYKAANIIKVDKRFIDANYK